MLLQKWAKTWFCHDDCEFWCIVRACSWICQRVYVGGGGLAVYIRGAPAVFLSCILPLYFSWVVIRDFSLQWGKTPAVFLNCILPLYFSGVFLRVCSLHIGQDTSCIYKLYVAAVFLRDCSLHTGVANCISKLYFAAVFLRSYSLHTGGASCTRGIQRNTKFGELVQFWVADITLEYGAAVSEAKRLNKFVN